MWCVFFPPDVQKVFCKRRPAQTAEQTSQFTTAMTHHIKTLMTPIH